MARQTISLQHRGWAWDEANQTLDLMVNGVEIASFSSAGITTALDTDQTDRGTVTQQTDKGTGVTLNNRAGTITTDNAALAAAAEITFIVTNSTVAITDVIVLSIQSGGTSGEYLAHVTDVGAGVFDITLANMSASSASDAVLINFRVLGVV